MCWQQGTLWDLLGSTGTLRAPTHTRQLCRPLSTPGGTVGPPQRGMQRLKPCLQALTQLQLHRSLCTSHQSGSGTDQCSEGSGGGGPVSATLLLLEHQQGTPGAPHAAHPRGLSKAFPSPPGGGGGSRKGLCPLQPYSTATPCMLTQGLPGTPRRSQRTQRIQPRAAGRWKWLRLLRASLQSNPLLGLLCSSLLMQLHKT